MVLDINFMTLTSLILIDFIFLQFIVHLRSSSKKFIINNQFNVILSYLKQNLDNNLFNTTTCIVF